MSLVLATACMRQAVVPIDLINISSAQDLPRLFPTTPTEIEDRINNYIKQVQEHMEKLKNIPANERNFKNTAQAFDEVTKSDLSIFLSMLFALQNLHPDEAIRDAAQQALSKASAFLVDITSDKKLYQAFKEYVEGAAQQEQLNDEERYFLKETMQDFIRMGLELPDETLEKVKKLKKELTDLSLTFEKNNADDHTTIEATEQELVGVDKDFIASLPRTETGAYLLGIDYPTLSAIMEKAQNADTRKRLQVAFNNRAYPVNEEVLKQIIAKRDELARLLGFKSYAQLDIDDQMAKTPERAEHFIDDLIRRADIKEAQEFDMFRKELPPSVVLDENGKLYPWDVTFVTQTYKKKHYDIDEQKIAEYFPVAKTVEGLFNIYQEFFSLRFNEIPAPALWHTDIRMVEIYDALTNTLLGYVVLDLYPRPNKYSHAANIPIIPALHAMNGKQNLSLSVIMANFPKPQGDKPALFKFSDVKTFFHEFGHALHGLLGRTALASFSGTRVKTDFVELPSQMLEEWIYDKDILKMISAHYKTGEPLPDDIIDNIIQLKNFTTGWFIQRQGMFAKLSLAYFAPGTDKNVNDIYRTLREKIMQHVAYYPQDHNFASFCHLTGYGAKYYSYLWSKVFALDLFAQIKTMGLLNPEAGKKYVQTVIGRGGSVDPNQLLKDFLGREPNDAAFFADMGL